MTDQIMIGAKNQLLERLHAKSENIQVDIPKGHHNELPDEDDGITIPDFRKVLSRT